MLRNCVSVALNFILITVGMLLAYFFEKASYGLSGRVWQIDVPLEGVLWLCGIILVLWVVTLSSGFYIARLDPLQAAGQVTGNWWERVLHDIRWALSPSHLLGKKCVRNSRHRSLHNRLAWAGC